MALRCCSARGRVATAVAGGPSRDAAQAQSMSASAHSGARCRRERERLPSTAMPTVEPILPSMTSTPPSQEWPKVLEDYAGALVRMATARINERQYLLMGYVELFPRDMAVPPTFYVGEKPWTVPNFPLEATIAVSATNMSVTEALDWYKACSIGEVRLAKRPSVRPIAPAFGAEPAFGAFCIPEELPFAARWHDHPRIHRLVPMAPVDDVVLQLRGSSDAAKWLAENFGFNPLAFEVWLGSLSMVAPDPLLQGVEHYIQHTNPDGGERVVFHAIRRRYADYPTSDADALSLVMLERRSGGWSQVQAQKIDEDGYYIEDHLAPLSEGGYAVTCPTRGLLRMQAPGHWIGQFNLSIGIVDTVLNVGVAAGGRRKPEGTYRTHQVRDTNSVSVGKVLAPSGATRIVQLEEARKKRIEIESAPQRLFGIVQAKGEVSAEQLVRGRQEAEAFVAELVGDSKRRVIFVDPDWGLRETQNYAFRASRIGVNISILTSARMLIDRAPAGDTEDDLEPEEVTASGESSVPVAIQSLKYLKHVNEVAPNCLIDIFVMPGSKKSVFHDRFMVIDDKVWACGPSFNELGERIGLISRVHAPEPVIAAIEDVLSRSVALADWVAEFGPSEAA